MNLRVTALAACLLTAACSQDPSSANTVYYTVACDGSGPATATVEVAAGTVMFSGPVTLPWKYTIRVAPGDIEYVSANAKPKGGGLSSCVSREGAQ